MIAISTTNLRCGTCNTACSRTCCCHCCSSAASDSITVTITNCEPSQQPVPPDDEIGDKHDYDAILELEWIAFLMRLCRRAEKSSAYPLAPDVMRKRLDPKNKGPPRNHSRRRLGWVPVAAALVLFAPSE